MASTCSSGAHEERLLYPRGDQLMALHLMALPFSILILSIWRLSAGGGHGRERLSGGARSVHLPGDRRCATPPALPLCPRVQPCTQDRCSPRLLLCGSAPMLMQCAHRGARQHTAAIKPGHAWCAQVLPHAHRVMQLQNASWLFVGDDDTFLWPENLQRVLRAYDASRWVRCPPRSLRRGSISLTLRRCVNAA